MTSVDACHTGLEQERCDTFSRTKVAAGASSKYHRGSQADAPGPCGRNAYWRVAVPWG